MKSEDKKENKTISLAKMLYRVLSPYKIQILILTALSFGSAVFEAIGINALIPLFSFLTGQGDLGNDFVSQNIAKVFEFLHLDFYIKNLLIFICLLFILKAVILFLSEYIRVKILQDYQEKLRSNLFERFVNAKWSYLLNQKLGHIETVLVKNVEDASVVLSYISSFIIIFISLATYLLFAINISSRITFITILLGGVLLFILRPLIRKIRAVAYEQENINREVAHHINENIVGMKTIKIVSAEDKVVDRAREIFKRMKKLKIKIALYKLFTGSLMQPVSLIFICIIFAFAFKTSDFSLASFIAVIYLVKQILAYAELLQKKLLAFSASIPFFKKMVYDYDQANKNVEIKKDKNKKLIRFDFKNTLKFKNVCFSYDSGDRVLDDINFSIKKGEMVGLIGPSGAGKTTLVDIILRLFDPLKGEVLLDDNNIDRISIKEWRKNIGYVSQDIFLKNDTILNNIQFYNSSIGKKEVVEAAKKANIYEFIQNLPDKFNTVIGERGVLLSGGQRQRIIIARVLARKPKILILDEATSALDNESEVKIQKIINNLKREITVLVIAHRLSTVINSDRLLVLEKGKIIEEGNPQELLKDQNTYFSKVYNIRK